MTLAIADKHSSWPTVLPFELALGIIPVVDILTAHGLGQPDLDALYRNATFRRELILAQREVAETGLSFKRKAAIQAEMYLKDIDNLMCNKDTAPSVKLEIFKTMVKCGDLEPVKSADVANGSTFNIQINI